MTDWRDACRQIVVHLDKGKAFFFLWQFEITDSPARFLKSLTTLHQCQHHSRKHLTCYKGSGENKAGAICKNMEECWAEVSLRGRWGCRGHEAKAVRPPLSTTPIQQEPPSPPHSSPLLSGLVFQGPTSLQDVWCGSLDAGFLCIGRGVTAKWRPDTL